ncbi:MAG: hypothetical protein E6R04_04755 [Spirochaetes bacterium]|nr:MAG: hypothetical protein E6R04_04755 [Spirochaetota bacterium]
MTIPVIYKEKKSMGDSKKPWQSKTIWINLGMALAAFFPQVQDHVNVDTFGVIFGAVNFLLRLTTKTGVSIK